MKKTTTKNLRSEAAIKRVIKRWPKEVFYFRWMLHSPVVMIKELGGDTVAEIDLRELVKKRKPLVGVKKQLDAIVRGSKKKGKK